MRKEQNMKKKITALLLAAVMMVAAFMGCGKAEGKAEEPKETGKAPIDVNIMALKGPTAMGLVEMMENSDYNFSIAASVDEVSPKLLQGGNRYCGNSRKSGFCSL